MATWQYKAVTAEGRTSHGRVEAANEADLEMRLSRMGLDLVRARELARHRRAGGGGIERRDLITLCFHLEQLTRAGVPLLEALADLRQSVDNPRLRQVVSSLMESIEGGRTLSAAMAEFPRVFDDVFVALIRAGERSGELPRVLGYIVENLKWQDEQAAHLKKLIAYPAFVAATVTAVLFFLMTYLVPELLRFVQSMGHELPWHTRLLIGVSGVFVDWWFLILGVPALAALGLAVAVRASPAARLAFDRLKLRLPVLGPILRKLILARFANYFSMLYAAGIPVLECMRVGADIVGNRAVAEAVEAAARHVTDGAGLTAAFEASGLFPPLVLRMLRVGEGTGALDEALANVHYFYTRDVRESIERLQSVVEPAMTVTLGLLMAWVMLSVLGPIYDLITQLRF